MRISGNVVATAALFALALSGCGGDGGNAGGGPEGSPPVANPPTAGTSSTLTPPPLTAAAGDIDIDGSSTVFLISQAASEAYRKVEPQAKIVVNNHGTGGGFSNYLKGDVDIVDASRNAKPEEESKAKAQGLDWTRYIVGYDGITVVVNPKNTFLKSITVAQLKAIWAPGSKVKTWKDVDPSWPDRKIQLYSPDNDSGTFEYFTEAIVGKAKQQRDDAQQSADDNTLVTGVAGDPDGIGYFGYAYFEQNKDKLRAVPVQKGAGDKPVMPTSETILNKSYAPLSRPLYIFVKNASMKRPEVLAFVRYYLENIGELTKKAGYVAPTAEDQAANKGALPAGGAAEGPKAVPAAK